MNTTTFDAIKFKNGQVQHWDSVAPGWIKWWKTLEQFSVIVSDSLIQLADIKPNHQVLDIATGVGEPSLTVAKLVSDGGSVIATDVSSQMLDIARQRAETLGLDNIEFHESDAEEMHYPDGSFDSIICRWGLMFLPDVEKTLKSVNKMLADDRKFATSVWDVPENIPFFSFAVSTLRQMFDVPLPLPETPTVSGLANGNIENYMEQAGFKDIRTEKLTLDFDFSSAGEYVEMMQDIAAPLRVLLANQSDDQQKNYWQTLEENASNRFSSEDGRVKMPSVSISIVGQK